MSGQRSGCDLDKMCCSGEIEVKGRSERVPCAIKMLPYTSLTDHDIAQAELEALWDTYDMTSVMTCLAVFEDRRADGTCWLHVATE